MALAAMASYRAALRATPGPAEHVHLVAVLYDPAAKLSSHVCRYDGGVNPLKPPAG
jgi:hypothetical protein